MKQSNGRLNMPAVLRDDAGEQHAAPLPRRTTSFWRWLPWVLSTAVVLGSFVVWMVIREPTEALTAQNLAAARQKWAAAEIRDYDMTLQTIASATGHPTRIEVQVRNAQVTELKANGEHASTGEPVSYTIEGMFDILERELTMSTDANSPLAASGGKSFLRVRFDQKYGIPLRYLRVIGGTNRSSEIRIQKFTLVGK